MLDIKKILGRSWHILWAYRMLWVFGFILALTTSSNNFGSNSNYTANDGQREYSYNNEYDVPKEWEDIEAGDFRTFVDVVSREANREIAAFRAENPVEFQMGIAAGITLFVVAVIFGIVMTFLRYTAENASIRMVDEYEESGVKVGFRDAWKYGWNRDAWKLFLVNFIVHIPAFILFIVLGLVAWWVFSSMMRGVEMAIINSFIGGAGISFLSIFVTIILMTVLYVLRDFAWRLVVLEGNGVRESLGNAWGLFKRQWKNIGLMWLVMVGLKIAWGIVFFILIFPLMIVSIVTGVAGVVAALIPSLLTAGVAGLFSAPDYWPWIFAAIVGAPIFFTVTFSPMLLVGGWGEVYESSVWTLTYRELKTIELVTPEDELPELEEGAGEDVEVEESEPPSEE